MTINDNPPEDRLKGIICYYSGSGNTRLACQYIRDRAKNADFSLFNIMKDGIPDFSKFGIAGFATFTDFWDPPYLVQKFIEGLAPVKGLPAFVFNTYGFLSGRTQYTMARWAAARGFSVICSHSLHTPENYPPMVAGGHANEQAPSPRELAAFRDFISGLDARCGRLREGKPAGAPSGPNWMLRLHPAFQRTRSRQEMGIKYLDKELCDGCAICEKLCPYGALTMQPLPVFDQDKCYGCWSCYNHCPHKAIYTAKYRGRGQYPKPIQELKDKLTL